MTMHSAAPSRPASIGRELVAGLIGAVATLVCLAPPVLHLVTGPLGPLIGGFAAAKQVPSSTRARAVIAGVMGAVISALLATAAAIVGGQGGARPSWFPGSDTLALILVGVGLYTMGLGAAGAALGHAWAEKKQKADPAPEARAADNPPG